MPSCNTAGFPGFSKATYADVRAYFDGVKPWRSKYNPDGDERPIGIRAVHHNNGRQFNKAMRELSDGSIAFRLFDTDCVTWHLDGTVTVEGYPSMSTNAFIGQLTPAGIYQSCRHEMYNGRRGEAFDPVLYLMPTVKRSYSSDPRYPDVRDRSYEAPDWSSGMVIQCERSVTLNYSVERCHWVPVEPERLQPFSVPTIDQRMAREVSREYHLPLLKKVINAVVALTVHDPVQLHQSAHVFGMGPIMDALKAERYKEAIDLMPRGQSDSFGKTYGTPQGIQPGFLRKLRDHIYDHEGAITRTEQRILTPAQYKRYVADSNRFY